MQERDTGPRQTQLDDLDRAVVDAAGPRTTAPRGSSTTSSTRTSHQPCRLTCSLAKDDCHSKVLRCCCAAIGPRSRRVGGQAVVAIPEGKGDVDDEKDHNATLVAGRAQLKRDRRDGALRRRRGGGAA